MFRHQRSSLYELSGISKDVNPGETILIDDGKIKLEVTETNNNDTVKAKVIYGGPLTSNKGVNLPDTEVSLPCLSETDISNAFFALDHDVDWLACLLCEKLLIYSS